jgi:hypothetical protein
MIRHLLIAVASAFLLACAGAAAAEPDPFAGMAPVPTSALEQERAGFVTADGIQVGFGATVTTTVNGQVALVSTITLDNQGVGQQTTWVNPQLGNATLVQGTGAQSASAVTGLDLQGVQNATGVVIKSGGGETAVLTNVSPAFIQNLVVNTANGQTIDQNTALVLTVPGLAALQASVARGSIVYALNQAVQFAQVGAH